MSETTNTSEQAAIDRFASDVERAWCRIHWTDKIWGRKGMRLLVDAFRDELRKSRRPTDV